nr:Chain B, Disintegrin and metalloproteinase domain-containing protein 17 [Homo sapiens]
RQNRVDSKETEC